MARPLRAESAVFEVVTANRRGEVIARRMGQARLLVEDLGGVALELVAVPGGRFPMGSPPGVGYDDEWPQHPVTVGPVLLGRYPVTQDQWAATMGTTPSRFHGARLPVENVSWHDAHEFCRRLAARTGRPYRLPGEAEWEHAARGATTTPFACGDAITTELANYNGGFVYAAEAPGVYRHTTMPVGSFPPNAFGLGDTSGNVWEWCEDRWHDSYDEAPADGSPCEGGGGPDFGVARGGSWHDPPAVYRCAVRLRLRRGEGDDFCGFRLALSPDAAD